MFESKTPLIFAVFGNTYQAEKSRNIASVLKSIVQIGGRIIIEEDFAAFLNRVADIKDIPHTVAEAARIHADFAVSIGGDGTFLNTARLVGHRALPIIGINTGHLGFISDTMPGDTASFFQCVRDGRYKIEERTLLEVKAEGGRISGTPVALNEIAVLKHDNSSMVNIEAYVDDAYLATYMGDGLIVSTPTGSTGYSLSVGGPIIAPNSKTIVLSPIAAHSLSVRPFILNDSVSISLRIRSRNRNYMIAIDGRSESLPNETSLIISTAPYKLKIVRTLDHSFFDTLRNKLLWGADRR